MEIARRYGWRRGLPSRRFPQLKLTSYPPLSPAKDLLATGFLPPIWDQGQTGSCTGHGTTRAIAFARAKQKLPYVDLSRLFPYWNARVAEGDPGSDDGAVIGDVIAASQKLGDCSYLDYPTETNLVTAKPPSVAFSTAIAHKAVSVTRVLGTSPADLQYHLKHCIDVLGFPVVFGITVYESFESQAVAKTGIIPMPAANEAVEGGHCIVATGYDDSTKLVTCDNSWGSEWGIAGRFKIPYAYIFDPGLADDFHAVLSEAS